MRELKEHWCQEKHDFCRPDGTNQAHQEVARKLKPTWELCKEEQTIPDDLRREMLRRMLEREDAEWGVVRSHEEMEKQLDYLMGKTNAE